ncbi:hypothetical protein [Embleya sp. NPDC020630]|uniref:hypothetical protein n=1 Tax=Embleya sp. NPDC020630 TaxID=3363979 RepID=UPI0037A0B656
MLAILALPGMRKRNSEIAELRPPLFFFALTLWPLFAADSKSLLLAQLLGLGIFTALLKPR